MTPNELETLQVLVRDLHSVQDRLSSLLTRLTTPPALTVSDVPAFTLTNDQQVAWLKMQAWLKTDKPYFVLKGVAGAGKSFLMKMLSTLTYPMHFTAPTNKATSVLAQFLGFPCRTIYSLFGFRMVTNEDKLELSALDELPKFGPGTIVVIDEAGMLQENMVTLLKRLAKERQWRFVVVGDPYQLNPINEVTSKVWKLTTDADCRAMLTEVKRFDNQLLHLSIAIREAIKGRDFSASPIVTDYAADEGVLRMSNAKALRDLRERDLTFWRENKIACWRNKTVNAYNDRVRGYLGFTEKFEPGEAILMASPVLEEGRILAHTDEEFQVVDIVPTTLTVSDVPILSDVLTLKDQNFKLTVPRDGTQYQHLLAQLSDEARRQQGKKGAWAPFWDAKSKFNEVRYGYAMTAHRLQGSTVEGLYMDETDVLANPNELESFRMLYVLATRPRKRLVVF